MNGHVTSHYLAEIMRDLYFEESTGTLHVANPSGRSVTLHFDRGMLYFAQSNASDLSFGACLAAANVLPAETLSKLLAATPGPMDLADNLVKRKILGKEDLVPVVRALVERALVIAFSWPSGTFEFVAGSATTGFYDPDILFTFESILKGIGRMAYFAPLKEVLLTLPGRLRLNPMAFIPVDKLALKPHDGYILSRIDGTMRLDEIIMVMPPGEEDESLQFIYGLAVLGIVEFVPPLSQGPFSLRGIMLGHYETAARETRESLLITETTARIGGQTPSELLGIPADASLETLQKAYDASRATFRREKFTERIREKHKRELGIIENRLAEAFLKLKVERLEQAGRTGGEMAISEIDPESLTRRKEMVKTEAQAAQEQTMKLGERYFQKAREYANEKDFHNCIQYCRLAIQHKGEAPEVYALMGDALSKNPNTRWQKMAEEAFTKACDLQPWNAEYQVALGNFYQNQGLGIRARKHFEKALEIVPGHAVAKAALKARGRRG